MEEERIQVKSGQNFSIVSNYLKDSPKPKFLSLGYCIAGSFIGQKIILEKNHGLLVPKLHKFPICNGHILSITNTTNDIYVIETNFVIYIVPFKPLGYSLDKLKFNEQLKLNMISPIKETKNVIIRNISNFVDNIYLITTTNGEEYCLLTYV